MYVFRLNISEICMYSFARMCTINRLSRCYRVEDKLHIRLSYRILLLPIICEFHLPKTMELILVVVISAGMVENSQNGVSRSLSRLFAN